MYMYVAVHTMYFANSNVTPGDFVKEPLQTYFPSADNAMANFL